MKLCFGMKYYTYINGELAVFRLVRAKNEETLVLKGKDGKETIVPADKLKNEYVKLLPDAYVNIMQTVDGDNLPDVYVCINKLSDTMCGNNSPSMVLRQNIYNPFLNTFDLGSNIYVGACITVSNSEVPPEKYLEFSKIELPFQLAAYIDDSFEDIYGLIPNKILKRINGTLEDMKKANSSPIVDGYADTLRELMENNMFIENFRSLFNIMTIDFPIVLGKESYDGDGNIILNAKQKEALENTLKRYIADIKVIAYDKDLDVSKIVSKQHAVVADSENKIYLITFDHIGYIADGNEDVLAAMVH